MPDYQRLIRFGSLEKEQKLAANKLMNSEGLCTCGRFLNKTDAKFILGQVNSNMVPDPRAKNTLVMAAYCYECFSVINNILRAIKNRFADPEPDQRRHERGG